MKILVSLVAILIVSAAPARAVIIDWHYSFDAYFHGMPNIYYGVFEFSGSFEADIDVNGGLSNPQNAVIIRHPENPNDVNKFTATRFTVSGNTLQRGVPMLQFYYENFELGPNSPLDDWRAFALTIGDFEPPMPLSRTFTIPSAGYDYWDGPVVEQWIRIRGVPESGSFLPLLCGVLGLMSAHRRPTSPA